MLKKLTILLYKDIKNMPFDFFINIVASSKMAPRLLRYLIYKIFGMSINTLNIRSGCFIKTSNISVGRGTFINNDCYFENSLERISIGKNCSIGMDVMFCSVTHKIGSGDKRAGDDIGSPIIIGNGCWIGTKAVILPGVTIGDGCIIGAGAVVTRDCDANSIYIGSPAKLLRKIDN